MNITGTKMTMKKGDDETIIIFLNEGHSFTDGDIVSFILRKREHDTENLLTIPVTEFTIYTDPLGIEHPGTAFINLRHTDTEVLECGQYIYAIHIEWADGTHKTPVGPAEFVVLAGANDALPLEI
jgi:hypothetical protein